MTRWKQLSHHFLYLWGDLWIFRWVKRCLPLRQKPLQSNFCNGTRISYKKERITSAKILERERRTRHDLSSVAAIIIGRVCCLFSSFLRTFATSLREFNPKTRTISCSSEINYLMLWMRSVRTYSFSITDASSYFKLYLLIMSQICWITPIFVATALRTMGVSSLHSSMNLLFNE